MSSKRLSRALTFTALGAALTAASAPAAADAPARVAAGTPRLALRSLDPPTVHGTHFARRERVTLTLRGLPGERVRRRRASTDGSFTVAFAKARAGHCDGFTVRAKGDAGSRAML